MHHEVRNEDIASQVEKQVMRCLALQLGHPTIEYNSTSTKYTHPSICPQLQFQENLELRSDKWEYCNIVDNTTTIKPFSPKQVGVG
jgi:hypothetical protein